MKIRWIDTDKPVKYIGRANKGLRGSVGLITKVSTGKIKNVEYQCEWLEHLESGRCISHKCVYIVPIGCLRNVEEGK